MKEIQQLKTSNAELSSKKVNFFFHNLKSYCFSDLYIN